MSGKSGRYTREQVFDFFHTSPMKPQPARLQTKLFQPIVIAPTYNNARMLHDVLTQIASQGLPVLAVNDGSTDDTPAILERWKSEQGDASGREVITHPVNRGKADALRTGFAAAIERGYTHAVTIDTDGQLDPNQIKDLVAAAEKEPAALVVGDRDMNAPDYPAKSRKGRRISNFAVKLESGAKVSDSQCGFRVYPLAAMKYLECFSGRYGYETEILTRAAWAGVPIRHAPVTCAYEIAGGRISHLHPTKDTFRGICMHLALLARACLPFVKRIDPDSPVVETGTIWARLMRWFNPVRAWREVRNDPEGRQRFAFGLALGVFISNFPVYGIHTLLALYAAKKLKLHPVPLVVGSHLSTPPITAPMVILSIAFGHLAMYGEWPSLKSYHTDSWGAYVHLLQSVLGQFVIGSLIFGLILSAATYGITRACLHFAKEEDVTEESPIPGPTETPATSRQ